jgi:uncharacterized membrane protein YdbT with pleckstrin-like domain
MYLLDGDTNILWLFSNYLHVPGTILSAFLFIYILYFWARLAYKAYRYDLTEEGFRKECGVIYKQYINIPYNRIQNIDIHRGILSRFLGLSELRIQTAGMGSTRSEGILPGLSAQEAENLRNQLLKKAHQPSVDLGL